MTGKRRQLLARASDHPEAHEDTLVADPDPHRRAGEQTAHWRAATADADDPGDFEGGQPDELGDHLAPDGQLRPCHEAASEARCTGDDANDSAMRPGTFVRAVVAATSQANATIRRRARPWVMMTVPRTPRSGEPPTFS